MKTFKLFILGSLAVLAIGCDKGGGGGGGGAAAVPAQAASAVCNDWYIWNGQPPVQQNQSSNSSYGYWYGYSGMQMQMRVLCTPNFGYGFNGNNQQQAVSSDCAGYALTEMTTGRQVTCQ